MNNDKQGCFAIIIGVFLFVMCPIVLLIYGLSATPIALKIGLLVWVLFSTFCFTFLKEKSSKIGLSLFGTFIYAVIFISWYTEDVLRGDFGDGGLGGAIGMFMMPFATLVPLFFLGTWLKCVIDSKKTNESSSRKEVLVKSLGEIIDKKQKIMQVLDKYFEKIEKQISLVSLISSCMGNGSQELKNSLFSSKEEAFASTKKEIFDQLSKDEQKRFPENVNEIVDYKNILNQELLELKADLSSVAGSDDEQLSTIIQKHCPELHKNIKRKRRKIITTIVIFILTMITLVFSVIYIKNTPYRELHAMIENQSLTAEMLDWSNRKNEDSYFDLIYSEKGYKFLASELSALHRKNDIEKAMWLCIQSNCIDGINLCASDSFIDWVVDYARDNGSKRTNADGDTIYSVDGYEITISSIFDNPIGHYFTIDNGQNAEIINIKNPYQEDYVPTIK